ncbi:MAG: hypothetical protein AAF790_00060 [Planctomycetota bacterium]
MATAHLLPCPCGQTVPVLPRQAGDVVVCGCGQRLDVPPLSRLRSLPIDREAAAADGGPAWGFRQGFLAGSLLVGALFAGAAGYLWANEPRPPNPMQIAAWNQQVIGSWTPEQSWANWWRVFRPMTLNVRAATGNTVDPRLERTVQLYRVGRWLSLGVAAAALVVGVGVYTAFGPGRRA